MLLQGSLTQEAPQARASQAYKTLTVPDSWGDSSNALHPETGKTLHANIFQCSRTVTALPLREAGINAAALTVRVMGFPAEWKAKEIFNSFSTFGPIITVNIRKQTGKFAMRWAEVKFADHDAAERAAQGGELVVRNINAQKRDRGDAAVVEDCMPNRFVQPELVRGNTGGKVTFGTTKSTVTTNEVLASDEDRVLIDEDVYLHTEAMPDSGAAAKQADVLVACLRREDFLECCHSVITRVMDILASPPRNRSVQQLELVRSFRLITAPQSVKQAQTEAN